MAFLGKNKVNIRLRSLKSKINKPRIRSNQKIRNKMNRKKKVPLQETSFMNQIFSKMLIAKSQTMLSTIAR